MVRRLVRVVRKFTFRNSTCQGDYALRDVGIIIVDGTCSIFISKK